MLQEKIVVMTDSACDLPYDLAQEAGVYILNFGITVDGLGYTEREDFDFDQYYDILRDCEHVPSTAHITMPRFLDAFEKFYGEGCDKLLYVSINAAGSATNDAAVMAERSFRREHPDAQMVIRIVDSHSYSMAYGWYVATAAKRLTAGEDFNTVVDWLQDRLSRVEIILGAFSLRFMKKSGRISAAAAFAGELLGLRPVISLNDGISMVRSKVRGNAEVLPALLDYADNHVRWEAGGKEYLVGGTDDATIQKLAEMCAAKWGVPPAICFKLGAAVSTNTGPDAIAIVYPGEQRHKH